MANNKGNPLTGPGSDSATSNSSDHTTHSWDAGQAELNRQQFQAEQAKMARIEAAFRASQHQPSTKTMSNGLDGSEFGGNPYSYTPAPKPPARRTMKGK